jgi:sugar lactone lactonase YvrE
VSADPTDIALRSENILGECPIWSAREEALYWVDVRAPALHRLDPSTGAHQSWTLPEILPGVAFGKDELILALGSTLMRFDPASGAPRLMIEVEAAALNNRLNELKCDPRGRLWVGSMRDRGASITGSLYRVDLPKPKRMLLSIRLPNSLGWSPDGKTMYFADTGDRRIRAYDFDMDAGEMGAMRIFLDDGVLPGVPDGSAIDAEGCLWTTRYGGSLIARITPDGRIDRTVPLPFSQPTSCAFGGSDLKTLFITSARQRLPEEVLAKEPLAGSVLALKVDIAGLPEPAFDG